MAMKKGTSTNFSSPLSFVAVFGSGIRDPGSRIPDPKTALKERGENTYIF
jgi:hypothetical protein